MPVGKKTTGAAFWWRVRITGAFNRDRLDGTVLELGSTGAVEEATGVSVYFPGARFPAASEARRSFLSVAPPAQVTVTRTPDRDWNRGWKKRFRRQHVTPHLIVQPSWEKRKSGESVIVIDPKMAFGTGTHESTRLVLHLMEEVPLKGLTVADIGTGTGILAIAAARMGALRVFACDIDETAIENATENIRRNRCSPKVALHHGLFRKKPAAWPRRYDLILGNLQRSVILDLLPTIRRSLAPEGSAVLSGILAEEMHVLDDAFRRMRWKILAVKNMGEWTACRVAPHPR